MQKDHSIKWGRLDPVQLIQIRKEAEEEEKKIKEEKEEKEDFEDSESKKLKLKMILITMNCFKNPKKKLH